MTNQNATSTTTPAPSAPKQDGADNKNPAVAPAAQPAPEAAPKS